MAASYRQRSVLGNSENYTVTVVKLPVFLKGQVNAVYSLADEDVFANGVSAVRRKLHDVEVGAGFALRRIDMDAALPGEVPDCGALFI